MKRRILGAKASLKSAVLTGFGLVENLKKKERRTKEADRTGQLQTTVAASKKRLQKKPLLLQTFTWDLSL